jgi:hypothetical protein
MAYEPSYDKREVAKLASALLSDIEGGSAPMELLIAKALNIARLVPDDEAIEWLSGEAVGYTMTTPAVERYKLLTRRWDGKSKTFYAGPASDLVHLSETMTHSLDIEKQFQPSGDYALAQQIDKARKVNDWAIAIGPLRNVVAGIKTQLHLFCSRVLAEAQFSDTSAAIFNRYQAGVDKRLAKTASQAFEKLPHVFERLQNGDAESISHALTSCRRIVDSFADAIFPPRPDPVQVGAQQFDCSAGRTKNQLRAYVASKVASDGRRDRINKNLGALYDRVSAGVHADVTVDEAQALVLNTYLLLGEIVSLPFESDEAR